MMMFWFVIAVEFISVRDEALKPKREVKREQRARIMKAWNGTWKYLL